MKILIFLILEILMLTNSDAVDECPKCFMANFGFSNYMPVDCAMATMYSTIANGTCSAGILVNCIGSNGQRCCCDTTHNITEATTTAIKTTPKASICSQSFDIYSSAIYVKSVCRIVDYQNYTNAASYCQKNGMQLYAITNLADSIGLLNASNSFFPAARADLWINGQMDLDKIWYVYNPSKNLLFSGAVPVTDLNSALSYLNYNNLDNVFKTSASNGSKIIQFYCEYKKLSSTSFPPSTTIPPATICPTCYMVFFGYYFCPMDATPPIYTNCTCANSNQLIVCAFGGSCCKN